MTEFPSAKLSSCHSKLRINAEHHTEVSSGCRQTLFLTVIASIALLQRKKLQVVLCKDYHEMKPKFQKDVNLHGLTGCLCNPLTFYVLFYPL